MTCTRQRLSILLSFCAAFALCATKAQAQYAGEPEYELTAYGYRDHTGFFSHIDIGLGFTTATADYSGTEVETSGIGSAWHFAMGGSVMPRLAVHFSAFGFDTYAADLLIAGDKVKGEDGGITSTALGAGVTYYLPLNLYFSGALGVAFPAVVDPELKGKALKPGLAARAAIGYEWWIGAYWGLGVAGQLQYLRAKDDDAPDEPIWHGLVFGPAFTATQN